MLPVFQVDYLSLGGEGFHFSHYWRQFVIRGSGGSWLRGGDYHVIPKVECQSLEFRVWAEDRDIVGISAQFRPVARIPKRVRSTYIAQSIDSVVGVYLEGKSPSCR